MCSVGRRWHLPDRRRDRRFSTLAELVGLAGHQDALNAKGPYTIFAPTHEAFAALPESTLDHLKTQEGKAELTEILKFHVADSTVLAGEVALAGRKNEGPR
ncbi:fasciclin domain-containing protein [Hyphomonas sp.]|uniref:fasciclin domain-containing protein n=1 Tax=Hyphomonas sp. TaxID=87 RepID=UPI0034522E80